MKAQLLSATFCLLTLTACGSSDSSDGTGQVDYGEAPYDYPQYQDALDEAALFKDDNEVIAAGGFDDFANNDFYINTDTHWLTFNATGEHSSSELRFSSAFSVSETDFYRLSATVLPNVVIDENTTENEEQQLTLVSINNDEGYAPLVSIIWSVNERDGYTNSYWAVVNNEHCAEGDDDANCFTYTYLAAHNENSTTQFTLLVEDNTLSIDVDGINIEQVNVSSWPSDSNYFSAGVSNQFENGTSNVQYQTLTYNTNLPIADLDENSPPSDNFDLQDWYLSVPTDTDNSGTADSIKENELASGYEDNDFFYTNEEDGGMVFVCPISGYKTSTNTSYTRTELREMLRRGNTSISTQGVNENNWVFSSTTQDAQNNAGGVDGILEATVAVNAVTTSGDSDQRGRVIIGQIHANDDEPIRVYYRLLPGHSKGSIYFAHEPRTGDEKWITLIGSKSNSASEPSDGIALNEKFYYKITVQGNLLTLTIKRDYKDDIISTLDMSGSGYDDADQYMYFKAGVYNQNKSGDDDDYVQATFYYLNNQHTGYNN